MTSLEPLPGIPGWEMWSVTSFIEKTKKWSARPVGAPHSYAHSDSVPELVVVAVEWLNRPQIEIDATIADLRRKLEDTPENFKQERLHLKACITTEVTARTSHVAPP